MQYLGSVQNLDLLSSWFSYRFESEDHAIPWFCQKLKFVKYGRDCPFVGLAPLPRCVTLIRRGKPLEPSVLPTLLSAAPSGTLRWDMLADCWK